MSEVPPSTDGDVLDRHHFTEAVGGYVECLCGWPTREQWEAGEHEAEHVIADLIANGHLTRVTPPAVDR